jgi:hypothetical protein
MVVSFKTEPIRAKSGVAVVAICRSCQTLVPEEKSRSTVSTILITNLTTTRFHAPDSVTIRRQFVGLPQTSRNPRGVEHIGRNPAAVWILQLCSEAIKQIVAIDASARGRRNFNAIAASASSVLTVDACAALRVALSPK